MFKELFTRSGYELDYVYDWNIVAEEKKKSNDKEKSDLVNTLNLYPPPAMLKDEKK
jgi:hypothetical protein